MRNFRTLNIWRDGMTLVKEAYRISVLYPEHERFGYNSQICRAVVTVLSNIAEGSTRNNESKYRYPEISIGSLFELESQLIIIQE